MSIYPTIAHLFAERGHLNYGENVTQLEHALQCAYLAQADQQPDSLVVAALLHDIGHLLYGEENAADHGEDDAHEILGDEWLKTHFGPEVCEPVRLHVEAKRYLCAVDPEYANGLSDASRISLELQGGPMHPEECRAFESEPFYREAVILRRYDDEGKKEIQVPGIDTYQAMVEQLERTSVSQG